MAGCGAYNNKAGSCHTFFDEIGDALSKKQARPLRLLARSFGFAPSLVIFPGPLIARCFVFPSSSLPCPSSCRVLLRLARMPPPSRDARGGAAFVRVAFRAWPGVDSTMTARCAHGATLIRVVSLTARRAHCGRTLPPAPTSRAATSSRGCGRSERRRNLCSRPRRASPRSAGRILPVKTEMKRKDWMVPRLGNRWDVWML